MSDRSAWLPLVQKHFETDLAAAARTLKTMEAVGLDPAQCSISILTTVTDVVGFFASLRFAVLFESHLI